MVRTDFLVENVGRGLTGLAGLARMALAPGLQKKLFYQEKNADR